MVQHILIGSGQPDSQPQYTGQEYFDQNQKVFYKAGGGNVQDWQRLGDALDPNTDTSASSYVRDYLNGSQPYSLTSDYSIYFLRFGTTQEIIINPPLALEPTQYHQILVFGNNVSGGEVNVNFGMNVIWREGSTPAFPTDSRLVEIQLFTLDGGRQWYGKVLGSYSDQRPTS